MAISVVRREAELPQCWPGIRLLVDEAMRQERSHCRVEFV